MEKKNTYIYTAAGILTVCIVGTLMHFAYHWSKNAYLVGLIAPVNESVWEHMKLLFFPMLFYTCFEKKITNQTSSYYTCADATGILTGTLMIPVLFYTYTGILGFHIAVLDILTFIVSVIIAFFVRLAVLRKYSLEKRKHCRLLMATVFLFCICFLVFTYYPPSLGIFQLYGPQ